MKQHMPLISFGKLKVSYGTTGNDGIGDYQYMELYHPLGSPLSFQGLTGLEPVRLPSPSLQWEETKKLSIGLDLVCLKERITLEACYYHKLSSGQLLALALPTVTGFQNMAGNLGAAVVQNNGWELDLHTINMKKGKFAWQTHFTITIPRNKLLSFPGLETSPYAYDYAIGQSTNLRRVFKFEGVNPLTGLYKTGATGGEKEAEFVNIDLNPSYYGGCRQHFSYQQWELDISFQFVKQLGVNYRLGDQPGQFNAGSGMGNQPVYVLDRWQKPGDIASVQKASSDPSVDLLQAYQLGISSSAVYADASYIRLKNVCLSWLLAGIWKKMPLRDARLFFQGQNLLTFTHYKGLHPETRSMTSLPPLRVFSFGIQASI